MPSDSPLDSLFKDEGIIQKIRARLPHLFYLAELDASRAGKLGMEVGSVRERIIIALLMYKFGVENVNANTPITEPEVDVVVFENPVSIKTVSGRTVGGVKIIWTVDPQKAREFCSNYQPKCDILLIQINYGGSGFFSLIPLSVQMKILSSLGKDNYLKLPKQGTNPRGVEFSKIAMANLVSHNETKKFEINWVRPTEKFNVYQRWLDYWNEEN